MVDPKDHYHRRKPEIKRKGRIKCNTRKTQNIKDAYHRYLMSTDYDLQDVYTTCSLRKAYAYNYCIELMNKYDGHTLKIIGYNTTTFSAGFIGVVDGKDAFVYITKSYDRFIYLDELNK